MVKSKSTKKQLSEFDIIQQFFQRKKKSRTDVLLGIGDDAALLKPPAGQALAVSMDTLVAGVHFPLDTAAVAIGYKSLAVNLSDMAAMGAQPAWVTLGLTLPVVDKKWLAGFSEGFFALVDQFGLQLVGGDITRGEQLTITVQIHGFVPFRLALTRHGAEVGDRIYVTGTLGDAGGALRLLTGGVGQIGGLGVLSLPFMLRNPASHKSPALTSCKGVRRMRLTPTVLASCARQGTRLRATPRVKSVKSEQQYLFNRLDCPTARVLEGVALRGMASGVIDISDGLMGDLGHILAASGVGATVWVDRLPLSPALLAYCTADEAIECAMGGGDDYELCFTVPVNKVKKLERRFAKFKCGIRCVGIIEKKKGLRLQRTNGEKFLSRQQGFQHF